MPNKHSVWCLDLGAGTLRMAEFGPSDSGVLRLIRLAACPLGAAGAQELRRTDALAQALTQLRLPLGSRVAVGLPGFQVCSKFVKMPRVDGVQTAQIIRGEARDHVPFPLETAVWDYQVLAAPTAGDLDLLLVAVKTEALDAIDHLCTATGLSLHTVEAPLPALVNAFRFNYGNLPGCSLLLDIGARTTHILLLEDRRVYARCVSLGGNTITQEFSAESQLTFDDAEAFKRTQGFVGLGGAYDDPENPRQAVLAKVARQVMTRLHAQVGQTIQGWRTHSGGSTPQRVFLAGGTASLPGAAPFFAEKLGVSIEPFNPLGAVEVDPSLDPGQLTAEAHTLGGLVGLGLREMARCPLELNLLPERIREQQALARRQPCLAAAVLTVLAVLLAGAAVCSNLAARKAGVLAGINLRAAPLQHLEARLTRELATVESLRQRSAQLTTWSAERLAWRDLLVELQTALRSTEAQRTADLGGMANGVWVESLASTDPAYAPGPATMVDPGFGLPALDPGIERQRRLRYGLPAAQSAPAAAPEHPTRTCTVLCRAVSRADVDPAADDKLMYALEAALKRCALLDPSGTTLAGTVDRSPDGLTFSFRLTLKLKDPPPLHSYELAGTP